MTFISEDEKIINDGKLITILKTAGTSLFILSWVFVAAGLFPLNLYAEVIGCALWFYVACVWRDKNLMALHGIIGILATIGFFTN